MENVSILLVTPPFTQLNTPYPATAYLKGFLNTVDIQSAQTDLGLEVILRFFSSEGLRDFFSYIDKSSVTKVDGIAARVSDMRESYISTIDMAISYLQGRDRSLAYLICDGDFLPGIRRYDDPDDMEWAFGTMGIQDKARHLVTQYLEDISSLITAVDPSFGFSRYAEHLGRSASSFDELFGELRKTPTYIDRLMLEILDEKIACYRPLWLGFSVPFPGNLYSAFRCAAHVRKNYPHIRIEMGGGFPTTELRQLSDPRVFDFFHYITLDDGELPLLRLLSGNEENLVRTFLRENGNVVYRDSREPDIPMCERGVPDYEGLPLDKYLSVIEMINPMHALWSNGRWNKLTLAHGCYWGKCAFCDGSLDYIGRYEPLSASEIVDRMEVLLRKTGERGFHFVDEAAPPVLLKELSLELIRRKMTVVWWTNIRFEKSFTKDLCRLMKRAGCIAVSGGLETASDRLLKLINKGISIAQVARVTDNFMQAGIMVHAYLMYGFPSQTTQETIDSLEIVRQLFLNGLVQSAFWHRFALTAHSPVGKAPEKYSVRITEPPFGGFARNDMDFEDKKGADHSLFGEGLRRSLYNYMRGAGFDIPLQKWFDCSVPRTSIPPNYIERLLDIGGRDTIEKAGHLRLFWPDIALPCVTQASWKNKGGRQDSVDVVFRFKNDDMSFQIRADWGIWIEKYLRKMSESRDNLFLSDMEADFVSNHLGDFNAFLSSPLWNALREQGLLLV